MKKKFFFDHIYKAGGSSIERAFLEWLGEAQMSPGLVEPATDALMRYADKILVTGHFSFSPNQWFDPERYALTMLRHPVDRIVSHYYFAKRDVGLRGGDVSVELAKSLSFEEYVHNDVPEIRNHLENFQVRHYFPLVWDGSKDLSQDEQFELAKQALHRYDLVGVFEEFEDFLIVLAIEAGWLPLEQIPRVNVTSKRPRLVDVDSNILRHLEELNQLDIALYEHALGLFQSKRSEVLMRCGVTLSDRTFNEIAHTRNELPHYSPSPCVTKPKPADYGNRQVELLQANLRGEISLGAEVLSGEMVCLRVDFRVHQPAENVALGIVISDHDGRKIFGTNSKALGKIIQISEIGDYYGEFRFRCDVGYGRYRVAAALHPADDLTGKMYHWRDEITYFSVEGNMGYFWEGVANLYPTLQCGSLVALSRQSLSLLDASENWPRTQSLAIHTQPLTDFSATIHLLGKIEQMEPNEILALEVEVCNNSTQTWGATGLRAVRVSYHWLDNFGQILVFDGERTQLSHSVQSNERMRLWATVKAPSIPGNYVLALTLVQENVAWFDQMGCAAQTVHICVR
ncbi:Wzt carbohydrate-binding domain-containing protein [Methylobacter marinus]|uniref:Wzt carbohydrate-binding domain-containing protein n=1 Tax=Methylobacter marinus TaxID=34058 RepID=UPI0003A0B5E0|nr:Wzt carbohydrate-binding domain-containing protein [Methylobacter marinus]